MVNAIPLKADIACTFMSTRFCKRVWIRRSVARLLDLLDLSKQGLNAFRMS
jgi:hypothetical protein